MIPNIEKIIKRIFEYAKISGIELHTPERYSYFGMKGFTPHLRSVNLYKNKSKITGEDRHWIAHDILHIMFYDYIYIHLKNDAWNSEDRFYENHLASEAFAVQALDYHLLRKTGSDSITVSLNPQSEKKLIRENINLPNLDSFEFCEKHVNGYLCGDFSTFELPKPSPFYSNWISHEISYSKKQRYYVSLWFADLTQDNNSHIKPIELYGSQIHFAVWDLIQQLIYSDDKNWKTWCLKIKKSCKGKNYFSKFPKYKIKNRVSDFRFTDIDSCSLKYIDEYFSLNLNKVSNQPSVLFLIWQVLSSFPEKSFSQQEKFTLEKLFQMSQMGNVNERAWSNIWGQSCEIALSRLTTMKLKQSLKNKKRIASFFLP